MSNTTNWEEIGHGVALIGFMGVNQIKAVMDGLSGEEGKYFSDVEARLAGIVETMPKTYEQDGKGDDAIVYLHYFAGAFDWWITEKDREIFQLQAFGYTNLGHGAELGYISLDEITEFGVELDFHFMPCTVGELKLQNKIWEE